MVGGATWTIIFAELVIHVLSQTCNVKILANTGIPSSKLTQNNPILSQRKSENLEDCYKECCNSQEKCNAAIFDSSPPSEQSNNSANCVLYKMTSKDYPTVHAINKTLMQVSKVEANNTNPNVTVSPSLPSTELVPSSPVTVTTQSQTTQTPSRSALTPASTTGSAQTIAPPSIPNGNTTSKRRFIFNEESLLQGQTTEVKDGWVGKYSEDNITDKHGNMTISKNLLKTTPLTTAAITSKATTLVPPREGNSTNVPQGGTTASTNTATGITTNATKELNASSSTAITKSTVVAQTVSPIQVEHTNTPGTNSSTLNITALNILLATTSPPNITTLQTNGWIGQFNESHLTDKNANISVNKANASHSTTPMNTTKSTATTSPTTTTNASLSLNSKTVTKSNASTLVTTANATSIQNTTTVKPIMNSTVPIHGKSDNETHPTNATNILIKPVNAKDDSMTSLQRSTISAALIAAMSFGILFFVAIAALFTKKLYENWKHRHYSRVDFLVNGMYG